MQEPSVLIVGAGPAGLVLALVLLQSGVPVRIIDKELRHRVGSKGAGIQPRTLEFYAALGVLDDMMEPSIPILPTAMYDYGNSEPKATALLMKQHDATPDIPHPNAVALGQNRHEEILRAHLAAYSCSVELGTELRSFEQYEDRVIAHLDKTASDGTSSQETATFAWLVGTDGARSAVRKQLGLKFLGETHMDTSAALGDIIVEEGLDKNHWHMWRVDSTMMMLRPNDSAGKSFAYMYNGEGHEKLLSSDEFAKKFYEFTGRRDVKFGETTWASEYRANIRMVDTMRQGRVFVAGDAAHCHMPNGGQGLNSSVQDSANLGWKLALVIKSLAPPTLLDTYADERLRIIAHMLGLTTERFHEARKQHKFQHGDALRMLGVNYSGSAIIVAGPDAPGAEADPYEGPTGTRIQAAFRAPDAPGLRVVYAAGGLNAAPSTRLFEVFRASVHTVLIFGGDASTRMPVLDFLGSLPAGVLRKIGLSPSGGELSSDFSAFNEVLEDTEGHAYRGYGLEAAELTIVVVRPDTVVGVVASGVADVERYFRQILLSV